MNANLRCATHIKSFVPSRIVDTDLKDFGREGVIKIQFTYGNKPYEFQVPYTRPYADKATLRFANVLNLNQKGKDNNDEFQKFIIEITKNFQINPAIEIPCTIENQLPSSSKNGDSQINLNPNPPKPPISSGGSVSTAFPKTQSEIHYMAFAINEPGAFCVNHLKKAGLTQAKIDQLILTVNNQYECGNTFTHSNKPPFLTLIPIYNKGKGKSMDTFLESIFKDLTKSQNEYFKKANIVFVYSPTGFPVEEMLYMHWKRNLPSMEFFKKAEFTAE